MNRTEANNIWFLLETLTKHRGLIFWIVTLATLVSVATAFLLPQWYRATALLLPPKNVTVSTGEIRGLSEVASVTGGLTLPVMVTPSDVYARILESETVAAGIIEQFNLQTLFETENFTETYLALKERAEFEVTDEGLLQVSMEDKDPQMAADIANAFVSQLEAINRELTAQWAGRNRIFIQKRLAQVKTDLDSARLELREFETSNYTVDLEEQTRLAIDQAISLKIILDSTDREERLLQTELSDDNLQLKEARLRGDVIRQQLRQLEKGTLDSSFFSLPISAIPALRGRYLELQSRVGVSLSIYELLLQQWEEARISENENQTTMSVLDRARPPQLRSRPQRTIIVVGTFALSLILSIILAAMIEYFERLRLRSPDDYARLALFINAYFGWLPGIKRISVTKAAEES